MRWNSRLFLVPAALLGFVVVNCGEDPAIPGSQKSPPDIPGGGCDASIPADQGGCVVTDEFGIFVSPTGADTNPGTKAAPFKSIQTGINAAQKDPVRRDVYVCEGTYDEQIVLDQKSNGVAIHGGFACGDWGYSKDRHPVIAPSKTGYVARVSGKAGVIENFDLRAKDGASPGESSIAVFAEATDGSTLRRVKVFAGKGAPGKPGDAGVPFATPASKGADVNVTKAASPTTCSCGSASLTSVGGGGGGGTAPVPTPTAGTPIIPGASATAGTPYPLVGNNPACTPIGTASAYDGANGLSADVVKGATNVGALSSQGWTPASGENGKEGGIAQGGGGASGQPDQQAGGGGGCGGCGGKGGGGGGGGGASIGIVVIRALLRVQTSTITTADGGDGGKGGDGAQGQLGGTGGIGNVAQFPFCKGGAGGNGGAGSGGGGGAGGSSIGIAAIDSQGLKIDSDVTYTIGAAKPGGAGGGPKGATGGFGIDGLSIAILGAK